MFPGLCIVLFGNSVFLAGIKAVLERDASIKLVVLESDCARALEQVRAHRPHAVLFDTAMPLPDFAISLLYEQPGLLLVALDPCSDNMLVLSGHKEQAFNMNDLIQAIGQGTPPICL